MLTTHIHQAPRGTVSRLLTLAALVGLLGASWQHCRETHRRRLINRPDSKPEKLQVWEDEGGQSQMRDAPAP